MQAGAAPPGGLHDLLGGLQIPAERGLHRFGYLLLRITAFLVLAIFAVNVFLDRPVIETFMFSLALAVGLVPELLPVIVSINLARGARRMARSKVIVKRLTAIENFGSMDTGAQGRELEGGAGPPLRWVL